MPYTDGKNEKKTKVFDTFVRLTSADAKMLIRYNLNLDQAEQDLLKQLVEGLAYLGRAESWVEASLLPNDSLGTDGGHEWIAAADSDSATRTRLLAPMAVDSFLQWRDSEVEAASKAAVSVAQQTADSKGKKAAPVQRKTAIANAEKPYPSDLVAALHQENPVWQKAGWPRPPGSRWIDYALPHNLFDRKPLSPLPVNRPFTRPTAILLAIDGEGKRGTLRPPMKRALPLMELLHGEAVRYATKVMNLGHLPELMGTDADGKPIQGAHPHAHWIPLCLHGNQKVDHVFVTATSGFSQESVQAVSRIRWAYAKGIRKLSVNMVGQGDLPTVYQQLAASSAIRPEALSILQPSNVFVSATPLVLRKYLSNRGKKTLEGQVREELVERGYPEPASIEKFSDQEMVRRKLKGFVLRRQPKKQQPRYERSWGVRIRFDRPVDRCPIALGYASHFGLGLLMAE